MEKMKKFGKQAALILVALAVVVTAVVVLCRPDAPANAPQQTPNGNSAVVEGGDLDGQGNAAQLPEESPDETVQINQGTNEDPENMNALPIRQRLTWDAINAFPIKYADMPIAERRQLCVDFFNFSKTALWSPKEDLSYPGNTLKKGTVYGGIPYVTVSTGNVYRMMDFIDEATGIVDTHKYMVEAPDANGVYSNTAMKYFGGQCSYTSYWGWARVMNSAEYGTTYSAVPSKGFRYLGDFTGCNLDSLDAWISQPKSCNNGAIDNTVEVLATMSGLALPNSSNENNNLDKATHTQRQKAYEGYAQIQRGDGLVYITTAGHFGMCTSDAYVVRNSDGTIDGASSYILFSDQAVKWLDGISAQGDWYLYEEGVDEKKTFAYLFEHNYLAFTFDEFQEGDILEPTEVTFSHTGSTITKSQLFASKVTANYGIADTYIIVTDDSGREVYRHIVRAGSPSRKDMVLTETTNDKVGVNTVGTLNPGTYHIEIEVQLGTGERPTVYTGTLKV